MINLNIAHLASFDGNIGDNANISGMRSMLNQDLPYDIHFNNIEIRQFYKIQNKRKFDQSFVDEVNQSDLLIIGGGNYFELWLEVSVTGTTIDITNEIFAKIKIPVVFYGLGIDPEKGYSNHTLAKFKHFLDFLFTRKNVLVSVRNDGSWDDCKKLLGTKYAEQIYKIPDGGFYVGIQTSFHPEIVNGQINIGLNIAGDMMNVRFPQVNEFISADDYIEKLSEVIEICVVKWNANFVLLPHIYKDYEAISQLLSQLKDVTLRNNIAVAPYIHGLGQEKYFFDLYKQFSLVMGNRFHTNVCGIGLGIPTIGLSNYPKITKLYKELDLLDRVIDVRKNNFDTILINCIEDSLNEQDNILALYTTIRNNLRKDTEKFHLKIHNLLVK
ncbi:hypothetical protein FACS189413_18420 [Bacteroidia bacterium]|nr:hypothetical protein FACS189413_18420 [Bacteroidia bacterium]